MSILKYVQMAQQREEAGIPLGDICEYCHASARNKESNCCNKCGAPMKPLLGFVVGIPIEVEDYQQVGRYLFDGMCASTATIGYSTLKKQ